MRGARTKPSVAIVGAGFGGIGMGVRLKRAGFTDFRIFERGDSVGGVWRANTYPGAACDVPSHLYSFSFMRGHRWSRRYAPQAEILAYLRWCAQREGLEPHLRLGTEVTEAVFDADAGTWTVRTESGESYEANVLVTACGQLNRPAIPEVPGLEEFRGRVFHSAEWDHDHDLSGRDVAVIGTGASAIQFVPEIAPHVRRLSIYQRSAPWILPKNDREYREWERALFRRLPARMSLSRLGQFAFFEVGAYGFTGRPWLLGPLRAAANITRRLGLHDRELRRKATPDYEMGCKRVLFAKNWYSTLTQPHVELLDRPLMRVTPDGVVGADGMERSADTIIFGTGFRSHGFVAPMRIVGLGGQELSAVWGDRPEALLGTTVAGFPNLFTLYGPNTNHGSASAIYTLECQFNYALDAVRRLERDGLRYFDVRPEVQARWRAEIEQRSQRTVWLAGGCHNWYVTDSGYNTNNWPGAWLEYHRRTRRLNPADYSLAG